MPYSTIVRWVARHNVSFTKSIGGKVRISEEGLKELRNVASVKEQIREIEFRQFGKTKQNQEIEIISK